MTSDFKESYDSIYYLLNKKKFPFFLLKAFLLFFARSWMKRNSHVQFCSRDGIEKETSTITRKGPDFVNNIEED